MNTQKTKLINGRGRKLGSFAFLAVLALGAALLAGPGTPNLAAGKDEPVPVLIRLLEVGRPFSYENLTIVPIYRTDHPKPADFVMLDEALKNGWIEVGEVEGGRVPQVRISNLSKRTIYLMGGEILSGAKQDRILAVDLLLAPDTRNLVVPVFCVEAGRWTVTTKSFTTRNNLGTFDLRAKAAARGDGAQREIWDRVAEQNARVGVASPTSAYQDAYESESNKKKIAEIETRMAAIPRLMKDTVGVVIGLGDRVVSADIFADPSLFQKQWPKILRSSSLAALGHGRGGVLAQAAAADFLKALADKGYKSKKGLDLGMELSCLDDEVNVQALILNDAVIHLAAFSQEESGSKGEHRDSPEQRLRVIREGLQMVRSWAD